MKNEIKIMAIGGARENGKNMYAVDINGGIYILDCGLKYPEMNFWELTLLSLTLAIWKKIRTELSVYF